MLTHTAHTYIWSSFESAREMKKPTKNAGFAWKKDAPLGVSLVIPDEEKGDEAERRVEDAGDDERQGIDPVPLELVHGINQEPRTGNDSRLDRRR